MKRQTITLTIVYEDPTDTRQPPSAWDWNSLLPLNPGESVKVGTVGPVKALDIDLDTQP